MPSEMGISQKEVVDNVITALTSNAMIAPSYWVDPKTGFDYFLTVQYPEKSIKSLMILKLSLFVVRISKIQPGLTWWQM